MDPVALFLQADNTGKAFADESSAMYERATTTVLKNNMLLFFAYADFEEVRLYILCLISLPILY